MDDLALLLYERQQKDAIQPVKANLFEKKKSLRTADLKLITVSLARLLEGGVSLLRSLDAMTKTVTRPALKQFLIRLQEEIKQGSSFSSALESIPGAAPSYFVHILYAGEVSGSMPHVLEALGSYLEKEGTLKQKVREALAYPAFILMMGLATLGVLLRVVIPKLAGIYQDFGAELPLMTRMALGLSHWAIPIFLLMAGLMGLVSFSLRRHPGLLENVVIKLPLAGRLFQSFVLIQFSRLIALLLESGIPILTALDIVGNTFSNHVLKNNLRNIREQISQGENFSRSLEDVSWMDSISRMLVTSGEETGRLSAVFAQIAKDTEARIESEIQILSKLLEPTLILGVGLIVGGVVIATVLPIFDISGLMK